SCRGRGAERQPRVGDVLHGRTGVRGARAGLGPRRMSHVGMKRKAIDAKRVDLGVRVGTLVLRNPILTASGTFGYGDEYAHAVDRAAIGGVVTKPVTVEPRAGNAPTRVAETAGGMLNSIGLENVGLERFRDEKLPRLRELEATVIASIGGETAAELETLLRALGREPGVGAFEVNFSCPNVAAGARGCGGGADGG